MESWRHVWREGFVPVLSTEALEALAGALRTDDPQLMQRGTTLPDHHEATRNELAEACCPLGYMGAALNGGFGVATVDQCSDFFSRTCFEADQRIGGPAECRWFLNWVDDVPRTTLLRELLPEVEAVLSARRTAA